METSFHDLLKRLDHLSDQFKELKDGVQKAVLVADLDPEMALTRARKVLEYVIRDVYERRVNEPPGTRPLENLLQRLVKDGLFPDRLDAYANTVRKLGNVGTHTFGEKVTAADVYQSLTQLMPILEWYFEIEGPHANGQEVDMPAAPARPAAPPVQIAIVPKGLRSFDAQDADFFLDLLPGPRDKDGLPESLRFWKHRIETTDEVTFAVGVIYGPSGCGKSSLVKAGLLPRLAKQVLSVYVEATADDTETRLLKGLRKRCPGLPGDLDLTGTLAALHQCQGLAKNQKVLIVLDQFEQWLHAKRGEENTDLAQALRQCDGDRVQCVITVRDDFWLAVSRFMSDLHIALLQGQNAALVDLFDLIHARTVLSAFGRAFGRLEPNLKPEQSSFLDQAVAGVAQDNKVISVRLALFAEMMKGKAWTPASLKAVGGTAGVGVTFLEETFSADTAPPEHRYHQRAVRSVLKSLLPESGTDIKGHMRSHAALLDASGYAGLPKEFSDLLHILDNEIRLITPTDPEGTFSEPDASARVERPLANAANASGSDKYYQLTQDYLVPSLRDWLTRKQKETRRGRAELLLADRALVWNARKENRQLPSLLQWLQIKWHTQDKNWTPPQQKMMGTAARYHAVRGLIVAGLIAVVALTGLTIRKQVVLEHNATEAAGLVQRLLDANVAEVPGIVAQIEPYRSWASPLLGDAYAQAEKAGQAAVKEAEKTKQASRQLHASLALLPVDATQVPYLYHRLLDATPQEVTVIGDALVPHKDDLLAKLWTLAEMPQPGKESQRLRAASALAKFDPGNERWAMVQDAVAGDLVKVPAVYLATWMDALRNVRVPLLAPLSAVYREAKSEVERSQAAAVLADYATGETIVLADLLMEADEKQFAVIYPKFKDRSEDGLSLVHAEIDKKSPASNADREKLAKRQANAAVALLKMKQPERVWPLLQHSSDPRVRSYLVHRLGPLGADATPIVKHLDLDKEPDVTIRRALILSLGEFEPDTIAERPALVARLLQIYRMEDDAGLHGAAEWLLRHWKVEDQLQVIDEQMKQGREQRTERIRTYLTNRDVSSASASPVKNARWYVNGEGQTMVVIPGPVTFQIGSPPTEEGRVGGAEGKKEKQAERKITRSFAIAAKAVTVEQFQGEFQLFRRQGHDYNKVFSNQPNCPINAVTWFDAVEYCNWLSKKEGLQAVYEPNQNNEYGPGMKVKANYLELSGYRLPTESEWEYACRAEATTSRYYGETPELLGKYAWYEKNSLDRWMLPVGSLKPNDLGLFDMLGNARQWCQDRSFFEDRAFGYVAGEDKEDQADMNAIDIAHSRVLRGGSFRNPASLVRSAFRYSGVPTYRNNNAGFRLARTFAP